ncbi:MAG: transglycosylase SLT domain-containing protein [Syntrophobacteraceae bacterium]
MKDPARKASPMRMVAWCLSCCILLATPAGADIFKYVDKEGVIHFTNIPAHPDAQKMAALKPITVTQTVGRIAPRSQLPLLRSYVPFCDLPNQNAYEPHIRLTCLRHGMDHNLVKAVIRAESGFNSQAVSPKGAMGLMQLMPDTSRYMGVLNPFDPLDNIDGGTRYLRMLLDRFKNDISLALAAYNAGPENVAKYGGVPPYDETQVYVQRVLEYYQRYKR